MAEAINAGRDLHAQFAAGVLGIDYDTFMARLKAKDKQAKDGRQMAKAANFGLPGGLGPDKLVAYAKQSYDARLCLLAARARVNDRGEPTCGLEKVADKRSGKLVCAACREVAVDLKKAWFDTWEEMPRYFEIVTGWTEGELGGSVPVLGPSDKDLGLVRGGCNFTSGANLPFQGLAARGAKAALFEVAREAYTDRRSPLFGARPVVFIHDEIIAELPLTDHVHEAAWRLSEIMVATMRRFCPDVKITAEPALMTRWLKGAEKEVDAAGRLLPVAKCPACGALAACNWRGELRAHEAKKGQACGGRLVCDTDLRTLGVVA